MVKLQHHLQLTYLHHGASTVEKGSKPLTINFVMALWHSSFHPLLIFPFSASVNGLTLDGLLIPGSAGAEAITLM